MLQVDEGLALLLRELGDVVGLPDPVMAANQERRVRRAQALLHEDPARSWRLAELAAIVGCSPFHLARSFRAIVGMPLHQCLMQLRLRLAFEAIAEGCQDLAALALRVGFCEHAHLTRAFGRAFGESPKAWRERAQEGNWPGESCCLSAHRGRLHRTGPEGPRPAPCTR